MVVRNLTRDITRGLVTGLTGEDESLAFIFTVKTDNTGTSGTNQFTFPLVSGGTYNFRAVASDGTTKTVTSYTDNTMTFSGAGTYTVKCYGTLTGLKFNNGGDRLKLLSITQWGCLKLGAGVLSSAAFYGCSNLTLSSVTDTLNISDLPEFLETFRDCTAITTIPNLGNWNMSNIFRTQTMFFNCTNFNEPSIVNWNVSKITTMPFMFFDCTKFNQPIGQWVLSGFTTISLQGFLQNCTAFNQDLSSWGQYIKNTISLSSFMTGVTLSTANYDALLIEWANYNWTDSLTPNFGNSKYSIGFATTSRFDLIANNSWTITDGGQSDANNILYLAASNLLKSTANPADGTAVSAWKDLTASAYSLDQATGANQPSFETNELNGQPVVMGNGTSDFLRDGFVELNSTDYTIIAVAKNNSAAPSTVQKIFELSNGTTTGLVDIRYLQTAGAMTFNSNGSTVGRAGILTIDYNIFAVYKSGSAIGFAVNSNAFATGIDSSTITGIDTLTVFGNRNGGQLLSGNIAELIIWKNAVSFEETTRVINYLSDKYGIEVTLV